MTRYLLAAASVHVVAAAADHLDGRLADGDAVRVVAVEGDDPAAARDAADAANVARTRLVGADVETATREGEPAAEVLAAAADFEADAILVGQRGGEPAGEGADDGRLGSTAARVAGAADRPVVVLPVGRS